LVDVFNLNNKNQKMKLQSVAIGMTVMFLLFSCSAGKMAMKKGDKKFKYGEYEYSIEYFAKAINKNYNVGEANFKIGESYRLSNRIKAAEPFYSAAVNSDYDEDAARYYYGLSLKSNEKYDEARETLENYLQIGTDKDYLDLAQWEIDNLIKLNSIIDQKSYFRVKNLELINTEGAEYSPIYQDGELYFTSSRFGGKLYKATGTAFTNIYKAKTKGAIVDANSITALSDMINSPNTNEGSITFSPDGKTIVFAKGNSGRRKGADDVDLYVSRYRRGGWSKPELMRVNDKRAWDSTPSFSNDGRTLFFSSNRKGGLGGTDIYAATKNRRGRFSNVRNVGNKINTPGNDMFPYQGLDGSIYFASNGHPGLGGLDILVAKRIEGKMVVENLGAPINSSSDDFGLFLYTLDKGFFTSNREGGAGDDDIYTFINNDPDLKVVNYYLLGTTISYDEDGNEVILPNTAVKLFGANDELLNETLTGRDGKFRFRVYPEEDYILMGEKPDYFTSRALFSTKGKSVPKDQLTKLITNKAFSAKVPLDQIILNKAIVLENIYYDLDKWNIRSDAALELDKLVTILEDNPEIRIELSSHTDSRATAEYNDELSKKRAQSAVDYIVSNGIDATRLVARGYGESQLIISDAEIEKIEGEENQERAHQRNRRTEFKVIEYNKIEVPDEEEDEVLEELQAEETIESGSDDLEDKIDWDN
jgi:outer membrane protein OmpA-like peptidoglycan-associated protein/tetratricopeptide (TPR) repeat protein